MLRIILLSVLFVCSHAMVSQDNQDKKEVTMSKAGVVVPNEVIVQFPKGFTPNREVLQVPQAFNLQQAELLSAPLNIWLYTFNPQVTEPQEVVRSLYDLNIDGLLAQPNTYVELREIPNDPLFSNQWHHPKIQSPEAWDITTGGTTASGDDIVICVLEGANVPGHVDLSANHWKNEAEIPGNGIDDDGNGYVDDYNGWNVSANNDNITSGNIGHGTQVAGMMGAVGNNNLGVVGANWDVKMMVINGFNMSQASVVQAYTYPLVMRTMWNESNGEEGAFVVATNASWGIDFANPNNYPIWCNFYDTLGEAGILNCGSTANNFVNIDVVGDMPTGCPSEYMVAVTASNTNDIVNSTGWGLETIDVAAPGINVTTTNGTSGYGATSGTSFAGPLTAGVIGLMYSIPCESFMELVKANPQGAADMVRDALFEGVDQTAHLQTRVKTGGRINAANAIAILMENVCDANSDDVGVINVESPESGELTSEETITVVVRNFGSEPQSVFDVSYQINGGAVITEPFSGTVNAFGVAAHSFSTTADLSAPGIYTITTSTHLPGDQAPDNDEFTIEVENTLSTDDFFANNAQLIVISRGNNLFEAILTTNQNISGDISVKVYNLLGQEVLSDTAENRNGGYGYNFDMSQAKAGVYLVKLEAGSHSQVKRIIVK